ncbi:MAG: alkaline phosphatase [Verrucomicrobiae bacterium]|nr:alkaline phosphatase [Verrucomicrobiae bacterium]
MLTRRRFLQVSSVAASGSVAGCAAPSRTASQSARPSRPARLGPGAPRRIILVVSDGMSLGTLSCADHLSQLEHGRELAWLRLLRDPAAHSALMETRSLDSLVTDSAAASSSWGSGARVLNGVLNVNSAGQPLVPIYTLGNQAGWARGLVTTTEITHATPAGFAVAVPDRDHGEDIAAQYLRTGIQVLLGGGRNHFDPARRKDGHDLFAEFAAAGYSVARNRSEFLAAPSNSPWLGVFATGHLPYSVDHRQQPDLQRDVPTLAEMTARALDRLLPHDRFFLQVEGGRVDHACHNNDAAGALRDQIALDDALEVTLDFRQRHPETLVVVTTDHGNANLGLNGMGTRYRDSSACFARVAQVRASFPILLERLRKDPTPAAAAAVLAESTGWKPDETQVEPFLPFLDKKGSTLYGQMNSDVAALGQLLANHLGIGFTGTAHTSDLAPLAAIGPGADQLRGFLRNTDLFDIFTRLAGIDYRNPSEPLVAQRTRIGGIEDVASYARA